MTHIDLISEEREAFRSVTDTGLWDILIAGVLSVFAIAPLLSGTLGDFWSVVVFLPLWAGIYVLARVVQQRALVPRLGRAYWGPGRRRRLQRLRLAMLLVNVVALGLGVGAFLMAERGASGLWVFTVPFALILLLLFSLLAYAVSIPRFFVYGLGLAAGAFIGEWLFRQGSASHHGLPVVFGTGTAVIAAIGLARLYRILSRPVPTVERTSRDEDGD